MRVCQVLGGNEFGGLEKHFFELCENLGQRFKVVAIAHPMYRSYFPAHVQFTPLDLSRSRRNPIALWQLVKIIRNWNPDIVHAHANKATAMVGSVLPFLKCNSIATVHSLKSDVRMYNKFDRVIAVSQQTAAQLSSDRVEVVYNGITPPLLPENTGRDFLCSEFALNGSRPILITVGRLVKVKGVDLLLNAMTGIEADLLVVGEGTERRSLEDLASQLKVAGRVHFVGHREDVPRLLASADLAVISSRKEGFSYVVAEALSVRQIVLSTLVGVAQELLPEQMLVPCENVDALRCCILKVLRQRDRIAPQFEPLWSYAARELTLEGMAGKIEKLYDAVKSNE